MPSRPRNRVGEVYGRLTVVRPSERRTKSGNAYWWCVCSCGCEREVPGDKLSHNTARRKPVVTACLECSKELQIEGVYAKNDREEVARRTEAKQNRALLKGHVPDSWLKMPLTDAHARELGQVLFSVARAACEITLHPIALMVGAWLARVKFLQLIFPFRIRINLIEFVTVFIEAMMQFSICNENLLF